MNYCLSLLRPIDKQTEEFIDILNKTRKERMNHEKGRQMMTEIKPWDFDIDELGTQKHANLDEEKEEDEEMEYEKDDRITEFEKLQKTARKKAESQVVSHLFFLTSYEYRLKTKKISGLSKSMMAVLRV